LNVEQQIYFSYTLEEKRKRSSCDCPWLEPIGSIFFGPGPDLVRARVYPWLIISHGHAGHYSRALKPLDLPELSEPSKSAAPVVPRVSREAVKRI
jgi:hypothetical protein